MTVYWAKPTLDDIAAQRAMLERGEEKRKADWKLAERERLRDTFAAAALTGLLSRSIAPEQAMSQYVHIAAAYADAMLRECERTNHDAAPEACVQQSTREPERSLLAQSESVERGLPRTGDTPSKAEIDALEFVVEEGRTASVDDYGILRSWLIRLRPEWESQSYEESNEKRTNINTNRGIDRRAYEGDIVSRLRHWRGLHLAHSGMLFEEAADGIDRLRGDEQVARLRLEAAQGENARLQEAIRSLADQDATLTDEEREAIVWCVELLDDLESTECDTLRELLERLK
jgi:hypothetical protein